MFHIFQIKLYVQDRRDYQEQEWKMYNIVAIKSHPFAERERMERGREFINQPVEDSLSSLNHCNYIVMCDASNRLKRFFDRASNYTDRK